MQFDWYKVFWINPNEIKMGVTHIVLFENLNNVIDGDWDLNQNEFEKFEVYQQTCDFLLNNKDDKIYNDRPVEERQIRKNTLRQTFEDIKANGFKDQRVLFAKNIFIYNPDNKFGDEIVVAITRHGQLILLNGWHRLAIARILNVKSIPIRVGLRHKLWVDFYNDILSFVKKEWQIDHRGEIYQPIEHIEFSELTSIWTAYRYDVIKKSMQTKSGTLLDIGSLFGYFCHKFEDDGFKCTAVEIQTKYFDYLEKIRIARSRSFTAMNISIFNLQNTSFDVILALNVFHHFLKFESSFIMFKRFLNSIKMKEMFVQTHDHDDGQMKDAYINYDPQSFVRFICEQTKHINYEKIGVENNREIFRIF
jgi:hypothetical protein